ncbi:YibE/F family protein [Desulfurobacterium sp.]
MADFLEVLKNRNVTVTLLFAVLSLVLFWYPNPFASRIDKNAIRCKGTILKVDNSDVHQHGLIKTGNQGVTVRIDSGPFKGKVFVANNPLLGRLDKDKIFKPGDSAFVVLTVENGKVIYVNPQSFYRLNLELSLFILFALAVLIFGGWTGARSLLSFLFTALVIWKILIPYTLKGVNPVLLSLGTVAVLTTAIIFLVAGITKKGISAFLGSMLGIATTCILAIFYTYAGHINGAVMPFSEPLLYSGFGRLDLTGIYIGSIFLSASGAAMDIAMDIAASIDEIARRNPSLSRVQLMISGIRIGRSVVGTMVTTLLLAYCGGYITLLMYFMAEGVPLDTMFNVIYISADVIKTLTGSFGLILTAPFTAFVGAYLLKNQKDV